MRPATRSASTPNPSLPRSSLPTSIRLRVESSPPRANTSRRISSESEKHNAPNSSWHNRQAVVLPAALNPAKPTTATPSAALTSCFRKSDETNETEALSNASNVESLKSTKSACARHAATLCTPTPPPRHSLSSSAFHSAKLRSPSPARLRDWTRLKRVACEAPTPTR